MGKEEKGKIIKKKKNGYGEVYNYLKYETDKLEMCDKCKTKNKVFYMLGTLDKDNQLMCHDCFMVFKKNKHFVYKNGN